MNAINQSTTLGFIQGIGTSELLIIFVVLLFLFGAKKLPELARGMGKSIKEFKKATSEIEEDIKAAIEIEEKPTQVQTPAQPVTTSQPETTAQPETAAVPSQAEENKISPPPGSTENNS